MKRKNPEFVEKICPTCNKTFQCSFYVRKKRTFCNKSCASHHPDVLEKIKKSKKKTYDEKYGGKHPMQTTNTKLNFRAAMLKKYGVEHPGKMHNHYEKVKKTCLERYGNETYNNIEKIKKTTFKNYGVSNYTQSEERRKKFRETNLKKYGVEHHSQSENVKLSHYKTTFLKFFTEERFSHFIPRFTLSEFSGVHAKPKYPFECKRCGNTEVHCIDDGKSPKCINCDKLNASCIQKELYEFIRGCLPNENIISNDRTLLYPQEVDLYLPDRKLAIEMNGLFWHSELAGGKNKIYHLSKTKKCQYKEVRMIHIFENEWRCKPEIIKSIISNILGIASHKIYARDCEVRKIKSGECNKFLEDNHLQGRNNDPLRYGLYCNCKLFAVMTFAPSRYDGKYQYEMSRYCNKIGIRVIGGASKLFEYFRKEINPLSVVSYSDRRFFDGSVYLELGFEFEKNTSPNYHYIVYGYSRLRNRMQYQKHLLKNIFEDFDPNITEWENMKNHDFDRIWDCGNSKWRWRKKELCF